MISDRTLYEIMPFSHQLNLNTKMMLFPQPDSLNIPDDFNNVFFYNPSPSLLSAIKQKNFEVKLIYQFKDSITSLVISLYQLL